MAGSRRDTGWSWTIALVAAGLLVMAAIDLIRPGSGATVDLSLEQNSAGTSARRVSDDVELYHLLPDASADLGRTVLVAGMIVGQVSGGGFWVRDLRDNIVFIADETAELDAGRNPRPGRAVRIRGAIALFPPTEQADRLRAAGLVLSTGSNLVREVKVDAGPGGIEILQD